VEDAAGLLLDHLTDMNNTPEPRMPRIKNLALFNLMGVISSPCITSAGPHQALGWRTPDEAYLGQSVAATALAA
jgi:hypothetical protein